MTAATTTSLFPIAAGTVLVRGTKYFSRSGQHYLCFQSDGNLVVKTKPAEGMDEGVWTWSIEAKTTIENVTSVAFDSNGDLVATGATGTLWSARNAGCPGATLWLTDAGALQIVLPGGGVTWSSNGDYATDAPQDGWGKRRLMADPKITIISSTAVTPSIVDAVEKVYTRITSDFTSAYSKRTLDGYVVYITNAEPWADLKNLAPIGTMWSDETGEMSGDWLRGGTSADYLWITEQMICTTGVATRNQQKDARGTVVERDNEWRTFDQVVHEFAHAIDYRFGLRERITKLYKDVLSEEDKKAVTVRDVDTDAPEEEFAWGVQRWYGVGGTYGEDPKTLLEEIFGSTAFADSNQFECSTGNVISKSTSAGAATT